jgi:hypothetical protein
LRSGLVCPGRWQLYRAGPFRPRRGGDARERRRHPQTWISPASSGRSGGGCRTGRGARSRRRRADRSAPR